MQEIIGSSEAKSYMDYRIAKGISSKAHDFLDVRHGLFRDILTSIAVNNETVSNQRDSGSKFSLTLEDKKQSSQPLHSLLSDLQEEYEKKVQSVYLDSKLHKKYERALQGKTDKLDLYNTLARDVILLHQEQLGTIVPDIHRTMALNTVYTCITEYGNNTHNGQLTDYDKGCIAEKLCQAVNSPDWWKRLVSANLELVQEKAQIEQSGLKMFMQFHASRLEDIRTFDPKYDFDGLTEKLRSLSDGDQQKLLVTEWKKAFESYTWSRIDEFNRGKAEATTVTEVIDVLEKEKQFCTQIQSNHSGLLCSPDQERTRDYINSINAIYKRQPELLTNLRLDSVMMISSNIIKEEEVVDKIRTASQLGQVAVDMYKSCYNHVVAEINNDLNHIEQHGYIEVSDIKHEGIKPYLQYKMNDKALSRYLKESNVGAKLEDIYKEEQQLLKQQQQAINASLG
jgi:hypothetical protein